MANSNIVQIAVAVDDQATSRMQQISVANEAMVKKMRQDFSDNIKAIDIQKYQEQFSKVKFGNTDFGFGQQSAALANQIQLQKDKLNLLNTALENAKQQYGEASRAATKYELAIQRQTVALAEMEARQKAMQVSPHAAQFDNAKLDYRNMTAQRDLDMSKYKSGTWAEYSASIKSLQPVLEQQATVVAKAAAAHNVAALAYGVESKEAKERMTQLLAEKKLYADLEKEIANVTRLRREKLTGPAGNAATAGGAAATVLGGLSAKAAMDAIEYDNIVAKSFGDNYYKVKEWSKGLRDELQLNDGQIRKEAGLLNTMFGSMGMKSDKAYEMSTELTKRAYDMSSFYHVGTDEIFQKIRSGMSGEAEPLKALGVSVLDETVKSYAYNSGIAKFGQELTEQQKIMARYIAIMDQTKVAAGDLKDTFDSPANSLRRLKAESQMLEVQIGQALIPELMKLVRSGEGLFNFYDGLSSGAQKSASALTTFSVEAGGAVATLSAMGMMLGVAIPGWGKLAAVLALASSNAADFRKESMKVKSYNSNAEVIEDPATGKLRKYKAMGWAKYVGGYRFTTEELSDAEQSDHDRWKKIYDKEKQKLIDEGKMSADAHIKKNADLGKVDEDELYKRVQIQFDPAYAAKVQAQEEARKKQEQMTQERLEKEAAMKKLSTEQNLQNELFKLRHQGAYATFQDDLAIQLEELNLKEKNDAKILGPEEAKQYYDQLRVEANRIANDKIRKQTEDLYRDLFKMQHSGTYATNDDEMAITMADLQHRQEESARQIGTDKAAEIFGQMRAEAIRQNNEKIQKDEEDLQRELFKIHHQGAYASAQDELRIQLEELDHREQETARKIGAERAGKIFDELRAETARQYNDKIRKNTEDTEREIYKITHSSIEGQIADIEHKRQEAIRAGQDELTAARMAAAEQAKLFNDMDKDLTVRDFKNSDASDYEKKIFDLNMDYMNLQEKYGQYGVNLTRMYEQEKTKIMVEETKSRLSQVQQLMSGPLGSVKTAVLNAIKSGKSGMQLEDVMSAEYAKYMQGQKQDAQATTAMERFFGVDPRRSDAGKMAEFYGRNQYYDAAHGIDSWALVNGRQHFNFDGENGGDNAVAGLMGRIADRLANVAQNFKAKVDLVISFDENGVAHIMSKMANDVADRLEVNVPRGDAY